MTAPSSTLGAPTASAPSWLPTLLMLILGTAWGAHFSLIKIAVVGGLPGLGVAAWSTFGMAVLFCLIALGRGRYPRMRNPASLRFFLVCAVFGYVLPFIIELTVARHIDAGLLTAIVTTTPIATTLIAVTLGTDLVTRRKLASIGLGLIAAAIILIPGTALPQPDLLGWVALTFVVPICYAIHHNYVPSRWPSGQDSYQVGCGEAVVAGVGLMAVHLVAGDPSAMMPAPWTSAHTAIAIMVLMAGAEVYLYFKMLHIAGPIRTSQTGFVVIIAGVLFGIVLFDERPTGWFLVALAFLVASIALTVDRRRGADA